jgi:hypothetical protein
MGKAAYHGDARQAAAARKRVVRHRHHGNAQRDVREAFAPGKRVLPAKQSYHHQRFNFFMLKSRRVLVGTRGIKGAGSKTHLESRRCAILI